MTRERTFELTLVLALLAICQMPEIALAQGSANSNGSAEHMWGTSGDGSGVGRSERAATHQILGVAAGQVNAASAGVLYSSNITVMSIGSQNIISVEGNANSISAGQNAINSGSVTTASSIATGGQ